MADLPAPGRAARAASDALVALIRDDIAAAGGWIGFDRYMQHALYAPGLGYYTGGSVNIGAHGDFVTAPELGPFFADALAGLIAPALAGLPEPTVLELGAGTGSLARELTAALGRRGTAGLRYLILEPSAELRDRQQQALAGLDARIEWLTRLPEAPRACVIVANEVADALPAACFVKRGADVVPLGVRAGNAGFEWSEGAPDPAYTAAVAAIERDLGTQLPDGYRSEFAPTLPPFIASLATVLERGAVALVDYGLTRREYYHADRADGTLICHYRHRAHADPFLYPGLQDITAWVDFSAAAAAAAQAGLDVAHYTTQGQFVVESLAVAGGERVAAATPAELAALKTLILPGEMGERFKLLWLTRGLDAAPVAGRDLRARL